MTKMIILLGCKGSGKSTLGGLLAKDYECPFVDVDDVITKMYGVSPRDLYKAKGVSAFMMAEENACKKIADLSKGKSVIVSTGGGICDNAPALTKLQGDGTLVFIKLEPSIIVERIVTKAEKTGDLMSNLPAYVPDSEFQTKEEVVAYLEKFYAGRVVQYENIADLTIELKNASVQDNLRDLKKALEEYKE